MKLKHVVVAVVCALFVVVGIHTEERLTVEGQDVRLVRADGDGLDALAMSTIAVGPAPALAGCASWDIKDNCCPAGCAAKKGTNWPKADQILQGCMRGLGCGENDVKGATVFMKCDCK